MKLHIILLAIFILREARIQLSSSQRSQRRIRGMMLHFKEGLKELNHEQAAGGCIAV